MKKCNWDSSGNVKNKHGSKVEIKRCYWVKSGNDKIKYDQRDFLKTNPGSSWRVIPAHSGPVACVFNWTIGSYRELNHTKGT